MPKAQVTKCVPLHPGTRAHGSSPSEEREQAWQELGLVSSCREPRAGYSELPINVTLVTEEEHS